MTLPPSAPRSRWRGSLIALLAFAAVALLAWWLTHRPPPAPEGPGGGGAGAGAAAAAGRGASGAGGAGRGGPGGGARGGPPSTVGVAVAERSDLPVWIDALGTVVPAATVTVRPQVGGVLREVRYQEGAMVRAGELLATLDPAPFEMALMQARGQRQRDEAQLQNARLTLQRYRTLLAQDSIARQDVDTQAALVRQLEGALTTSRAAEGTARLNLQHTRITAPLAGRVGLRTVDPGNLVSTGDAAGIAVITQVAPIDVAFSLPQDRVPDIERRRGQPMAVVAFDRGRTEALAQGRFTTLDNLIDVQTGTVRAKARFDNREGRLFPNQFVNVRLLLDTVRGAVTVPVTAVRQRAQGDYVYVVREDRTVQLRPVVRGLATVDRVAIASGLQAGERVVTEGADRLRDGARVVLPGERAASGAGRGASGPRGAGRPGSAPLGAGGGSAR